MTKPRNPVAARMTLKDLREAVQAELKVNAEADELGIRKLSKAAVQFILETALDKAADHLATGGGVQFGHLGIIRTRWVPAKKQNNIQNPEEPRHIPARHKPVFAASVTLKRRLADVPPPVGAKS